MSMSSPNMNILPYIGVESGAHAVPELSRDIGAAMLIDDCMLIWCAAICISGMPFAIRWPDAKCTLCEPCCFGGGEAFGFIGTSFMPHFGHLPGLSLITSGCMTQV